MVKNWTKWTVAGVMSALVLAAMPAVGQARAHYTGRAPASLMATTSSGSTKLVAHKKHKKHRKHKKHAKKTVATHVRHAGKHARA